MNTVASTKAETNM